jgi:hypothetical protein
MAVEVSGIFVYPVKSAGGLSMEAAVVEPKGFRHDRRWMLVDNSGFFLSQRTIPALALLRPVLGEDVLELAAPGKPILSVPLSPEGVRRTVTVWEDTIEAVDAGDSAAGWLSDFLRKDCRLVYMPSSTRRPTVRQVTGRGDQASFADAYPFLLISQESLDDLNRRLVDPVPMDRFRPNIVVRGCPPFAEDGWRVIRIGDLKFHVVKPCSRCVVTTIDQRTAAVHDEPLRTLRTYRQSENKVNFGQNCIPDGEGVLRIGDPVAILEPASGP